MHLILLIAELIALYFLSRWLTQLIYNLCFLFFRSRTIGVTFITLIQFPGTVIHELSHLFTAEILGVHTGKLTLVPEGIQDEEVRAGSVMIAHSDPFRRYMIGLAPIFTGLITLAALSYFLPQFWMNITTAGTPILTNPNLLWLLLDIYALFAVSSSMFSSPTDLKGFLPFAITLGILIAGAYIAGLRIGLTGPILALTTTILDALVKSVGVVLAINAAGILLTQLLMILAIRITHRRIIRG